MFQAVLRDTVISQNVPLLRWRNLNLEKAEEVNRVFGIPYLQKQETPYTMLLRIKKSRKVC
jgi:hypothetical protein